jgi:uncharacterized protein YdeI (YjbR/CyaY-like superfamily)
MFLPQVHVALSPFFLFWFQNSNFVSIETRTMKPIFFKSRALLREWFELYHLRETELIVGYYKVETKRDSITWSQSVDEAICFGWIDGI